MEENHDLDLVGEQKFTEFAHFQDIRKSTVSETYQYLNKLLNKKSVDDFEKFSHLVSLDTSLPLFEESLRLTIIDSLHLENEIVKILLSQNESQIPRILGCKWFFQNLSSEFCTKQLFPYISISLRCKIINRLSKHLENSEEAEKYFAFIRQKYDNERAEYLLPKCSPEFILNYFEKAKYTFDINCKSRIFLNICKRYPEVGVHILSSIIDVNKGQIYDFHNYKKILCYLAGYHSDLIMPLLKKHHPHFPFRIFGKKLTKKLGPKLKEELFPNLAKNLIFKEKPLFSILTFEEQVKFIATTVVLKMNNLTFENWNWSTYRICDFLKWVPPEDRLRMIEAVFKEVYNLNYNEHPNCWSSDLLELIPTKSRQHYVVKLEKIVKAEKSELKENESDICFRADAPEQFIYLYDSSTAFEKFKEILRTTFSISKRETVLPFMVKNCCINNDLQMLQEVIEFITTRHRHDDAKVIFSFLDAVNNHVPTKNLDAAIFDKLEDLMYFLSLKHKVNHYPYKSLMEKHIYYRLEKKMNVETQMKNFFETNILTENYPITLVSNVRSKHSKTVIMDLCGKIVSWIRSKSNEEISSNSKTIFMSLLSTCRHFNLWNKHNRIYLRDIPGLSDILKTKLMENFSDVGAEEWSLDIWEKFYGDVANSDCKKKCLGYVLKRKPNIIEDHLEGILKILFCNNHKCCSSYFRWFLLVASFYGKLEKIKEISLKEFKSGDSTFKRKNALELYSHVCTIEEYIEAIADYIPTQERVPGRSDDGFDEIQILIPNLIKNIRPRWKNLQLTLKFYFGDFLKAVLPSLWSCCYNTRCDLAISFLKENLDSFPQKISYRKDIIKLIIELSDREGKFDSCLKYWDAYMHYSVRCILLLNISKLFLELPSKESFQLLEKCILECDTVVIKSRPDLRKIPKEFLNDYFTALWRFSENQESHFRRNFRSNILTFFDRDNIKLISPDFSESIIKDNLFNTSSELEVGYFTVLYLISDPKEVESKVRVLLNFIKDHKPNAHRFNQFTSLLIEKSLENPGDFLEIFTIILENWPLYPNGVLFEERILFNYHNLHQKVLKGCTDSGAIPAEFGKELRNLYASTENLNELLVFYVEPLKKFLNSFEISDAISALRELITGSQDRTLAVLAIRSLPRMVVDWYKEKDKIFLKNAIESKKLLNELIITLASYNDRIVEIYLRSMLEMGYNEEG